MPFKNKALHIYCNANDSCRHHSFSNDKLNKIKQNHKRGLNCRANCNKYRLITAITALTEDQNAVKAVLDTFDTSVRYQFALSAPLSMQPTKSITQMNATNPHKL